MYSDKGKGFVPEYAVHTFLYSGSADDVVAGKAVSLDTTEDNTVKLAGSGDLVVGRAMLMEDRGDNLVVAVQINGWFTLPKIESDATISVGDAVTGNTGGTVTTGTGSSSRGVVTEVGTDWVSVNFMVTR